MLKNNRIHSIFFLFIALFPSLVLKAESFEKHGILIHDPYQYLEEMDSPETLNWVNKQDDLSENYFDALASRAKIREELQRHADYDMHELPIQVDRNLFYLYKAKGEDKYCLCMENKEGQRRVLIDPSKIEDAGNISLKGFRISPCKTKILYGLSSSGSDFITCHIYDLNLDKSIETRVDHNKFFLPIWDSEGQGIYYSRWEKQKFEDADICLGIYHHSLSDQTDEHDVEIFDNAKKQQQMVSAVTTLSNTSELLISYQNTRSWQEGYAIVNLVDKSFYQIIPGELAYFDFIDEREGWLYFKTSYNAPNKKVIALELKAPLLEQALEVIPESLYELTEAIMTKDYVVCNYMVDCKSRVSCFNLHEKKMTELPITSIAYLSLASIGKAFDSYRENEIYFSYRDFLTPSTIYHYDLQKNQITCVHEPFKKDDRYITEQFFFKSRDGTRIPLFITHHKDMVLDGQNPTLMWGYGGFADSLPPYYFLHQLTWLEMGGIFVSVNLRGGSEYGDRWHEQGMLHNKQNVFDDFIAAAEYLIEKKYTSPKKLAIHGVSNGGLLVGACLVQRPDLFGAAISQVGVFDMLKFHKFTIGRFWISDYGNPEEPDDFKVLYQYSPYHNVKSSVSYPPTLIITADHDDRVVPMHSYKFAAKLQEAQIGKSKILLRLNREEGHGSGGGSMNKTLDNYADILSFLQKELSINSSFSRSPHSFSKKASL